MKLVFLGLTITSSWGNGHATTYRGLTRELVRRGHSVLFLERDVPWYASYRDSHLPPGVDIQLYSSRDDLQKRFGSMITQADVTIVGSYVPEGIPISEWVLNTAQGLCGFYDIDTPVTLTKLESSTCEYLHPRLVPQFDFYLSFSGGRALTELQSTYGAVKAFPLYCSVDPTLCFPQQNDGGLFDCGYMGTYAEDRQPSLEQLMLEPARRWESGSFLVAGPLYPPAITWPKNVVREEHIPPANHRSFYTSQRFTLNLTRQDMVRAGYSPSVRLFEAAACATPIISDQWDGLDQFFEPGREILVSHSSQDTLHFLKDIPESERVDIGMRSRQRVLNNHTAAHRAQELEQIVTHL